MRIQKFVSLVESSTIEGYDTIQIAQKKDWLKTGKSILKELAKELGLPSGSYEVRVDPAGPDSSGWAVLHGEDLYVKLSQFSGGRRGFIWHTCEGRKDYMGGTDKWEDWDALLDLPELVKKINKLRFYK